MILSRVDNTTIRFSCSAAASPLLHSPPPPQLSRPRLCLNPDQESDTRYKVLMVSYLSSMFMIDGSREKSEVRGEE
ncbi:hypothetical protein AKJ16_DCAP03805 [Drosera capensis]